MPSAAPRFSTQFFSACAAIAATLTTVAGISTPHAEFAVAIFPPWWSGNRAIHAAASAGEIVSVGQTSAIIVVHGDAGLLAPRLWAAGALLVLDAKKLAICSNPKARISL